jgi:hypothetical protein
MWTRTEHLQFSVMMGLRDGLKSIRGMRRALTEDEQHKIAEKIVAHLESTNWKIEKDRPSKGRGAPACHLERFRWGQTNRPPADTAAKQ